MIACELIQTLETAPPDLEILIKNLDGTTRPVNLVGFHHENGTEVELGARNPVIQIVVS
jgi:hypothetical protein